jgi:predicted cation transporter
MPGIGPFPTLMRLCTALMSSADLAAVLFQLWLNHAQRQFAGMYKLSARVGAGIALLTIAERLSAIVGQFDTKSGFTLQDVIELAVYASWAWQAWTLPPVPKVVDEED